MKIQISQKFANMSGGGQANQDFPKSGMKFGRAQENPDFPENIQNSKIKNRFSGNLQKVQAGPQEFQISKISGGGRENQDFRKIGMKFDKSTRKSKFS